ALDALAEQGRIKPDEARVMGEAYDRLRVIEHRLQMVGDHQTHSLPDGKALDAVARLDGLADGAALIEELSGITARTAEIYDTLVGEPASPAPKEERSDQTEQSGDHPVEDMDITGFADPEAVAQRARGWRDGRYPAVRSAEAVAAFDRLLPFLLDEIGKSDDPERALVRWERVLEQAGSAITLFRLCAARPSVLERLVATLTLSPPLADQLGRRPESLDVLLDLDPEEALPGVQDIVERIDAVAQRGDYEAKLDAIRRVTGEEKFSLGVRLIEGTHEPRQIAQALCAVAEAAIIVASRAASAEFARAYGNIAQSELVVLGLGRLGGGALTHQSDLDIIYLFTGDFAAQSDGERPLGATLYYNRLGGRVTAALSVPTSEGAMYEVDTRLRPQGNQGPLAVSFDSFAKYQQEQAWTWEHMALARSRVLYGSGEARATLSRRVADILWRPRDAKALEEDVLGMRAQMAEHKPPRGELDVKLLRGGLIDIEFIIHFLQLRDGHTLRDERPDALDPSLDCAIAALVEHGRLTASFAKAHDLMSACLVAGRLLANDGVQPPPAAASTLARACGSDSYDSLIRDLDAARADVARCWKGVFDQELEI
ncbi:glutamine-synthetase adenylyltransferase, partial [Erythrobacter sp.]|uniref:[protein-PII] uridylyltransferase family protein n=1 Tax=Erythrobacter sp. TaxID=1042 RepID=UPI003C78164D